MVTSLNNVMRDKRNREWSCIEGAGEKVNVIAFGKGEDDSEYSGDSNVEIPEIPG